MLNNRYVRTIILSRVCLQLGIWVRNFAILLYVTEMTKNDPLYVSLIAVVEYAPIFLFSTIGGTFADRWLPKRTMVWCDVLSAVSAFVVLLVVHYGSWYTLLCATFISAVLSQFSQPSAMKLFKQHVPEEQLQGVMAMFQSLMAVFMVVGPIIGAFVYQQFGIEVSLCVMGAMLLASALILSFLPRDTKTPAAEDRNFVRELRDGLRFVWASRPLRTLGGTFAVSGLAVGLISPLTIFVAMENLGQDKSFLQWLLMMNGVAMLVGGALVMTISKKVKPQTLLAAGLLISTFGTIGIGWSTSIPLTLLFQATNGLCFPSIHIGINTLIMQNTEGSYIGRVSGVLTPMFMGMMVIGMSLAGYLKNALSLHTVYTVSGVLFFISVLVLAPLLVNRRAAAEKQAQG
ncbi:Predicted arabinose efflux permease, MFS family [Paenibacillus tianmuensis]|uniref:Predicted arabinose efflux permease, MFS family n=1 Tax=Paenibacillus tianmuensis TaxID=624147 RepID=A0A1G4TNJ3_9BACL|nr:MFS transporter [Paenibacillus tianmuensis]SCW82968.1 Predicted arabinose efflux permease, MFS family [Paenibacillus tianmuensis]